MFQFRDKPLWKSLTILGIILFGAGSAAEGAGAIPAGSTEQARTVIDSLLASINEIGMMLTAFGLRKATGSAPAP